MSRITPGRIVVAAAALALGGCDDVTAPAPRGVPPRPSLATLAVAPPIDLGTLPTGKYSWATAVSASGLAAGYGDDGAQHDHAIYWPAPGTVIDLGTLPGGANSQAWGITDISGSCVPPFPCFLIPRAWVVGWSQRTIFTPSPVFPFFQLKTVQHAFLWRPNFGMTDLGTLGGENSWAQGVTPNGQVVGMSETASGDTHAFVWTFAGGMVDINPGLAFGTASYSTAWAASAGYTTGYGGFPSVGWRAVRWSAGGPALLDPAAGQVSSFGRDVNAFAIVVGRGQDPAGVAHALVWSATGVPRDIGTLPGFTYSFAYGINDLGLVVGESFGLGDVAYVWTAGTGMVPLPTLAGTTGVSAAYDVNNAGQVVGISDAPAGGRHATLWPVQLIGGTCSETCVLSASR